MFEVHPHKVRVTFGSARLRTRVNMMSVFTLCWTHCGACGSATTLRGLSVCSLTLKQIVCCYFQKIGHEKTFLKEFYYYNKRVIQAFRILCDIQCIVNVSYHIKIVLIFSDPCSSPMWPFGSQFNGLSGKHSEMIPKFGFLTVTLFRQSEVFIT